MWKCKRNNKKTNPVHIFKFQLNKSGFYGIFMPATLHIRNEAHLTPISFITTSSVTLSVTPVTYVWPNQELCLLLSQLLVPWVWSELWELWERRHLPPVRFSGILASSVRHVGLLDSWRGSRSVYKHFVYPFKPVVANVFLKERFMSLYAFFPQGN